MSKHHVSTIIGVHPKRSRTISGIRRAFSSSLRPTNAAEASGTRIAVGATAPSTTRASVQTPAGSSVTLTPAPTTAMSISVRGMKRR